jgi:hypothetical protein
MFLADFAEKEADSRRFYYCPENGFSVYLPVFLRYLREKNQKGIPSSIAGS